MNHSYPIFTVDAECQDCFKCVRCCPVKAIKVEGGHATVMPELCLACGTCVEVCPVKAKKFRDDMGRVRRLLQGEVPVYASLAPSWVSEFKGVPAGRMVAALRRLGFAGVSETALGAQVVSQAVARQMREKQSGLVISSACPVVVDLVRKYLPDFAESISPLLSPALTHARMLHQRFGAKIKVAFIGPCVAKKNEADQHPELIAVAIMFPRLRQMFKEAGIDPWHLEPGPEDHFVLADSEEGALYPIEGGMNETIRAHGGCEHVNFSCISGIAALRQALDGLTPRDVKDPVFIEALACIGGCVHGPGTEHGSPGLLERLRILRHAGPQPAAPERETLEIGAEYSQTPVIAPRTNLQEIKQALRAVGKTRPEDEINCGGCGYDTCLNFAKAFLEGKAEPNMCVSYLRNLAQKKSNAMLRCIPAAVAIVDKSLNLIECNRRFAELCGEETVEVFETAPGLPGANLRRLIAFPELFEQVLRSGDEVRLDTHRWNRRLLSINIFNIDPGQVVGCIMFDVTGSELQREQIASRAREVINKNLTTVQDIACRLGEHMAETEILLRSIAEGYADKKS